MSIPGISIVIEKNLEYEARIKDLELLASNLCKKLLELECNSEYRAIWGLAFAHGIKYQGPTFGKELKALEDKLNESKKS